LIIELSSPPERETSDETPGPLRTGVVQLLQIEQAMPLRHYDYRPLVRALALGLIFSLLSACGGRAAVFPSEDSSVKPDVSVDSHLSAASDARAAWDASVLPDTSSGIDPQCAEVRCDFVEDCCTCAVFGPNNPPTPTPYCPDDCEQYLCGAYNLAEGVAYCLKGQCLLASTRTCSKDADCVLINDCCTCMAAPVGHALPECLADCKQSTCSAWGLGQAQARCVRGRCQLSLE